MFLVLVLAAVYSSEVGAGAAVSISFWVRINVAILFLNACLTLLHLFSITCLLTVRFLALSVRAVGGLGGAAAYRRKQRGFVVAPFGLVLALPLLIFWVCLALLPSGGGASITICFGIGVFFLVVFWWMRGALRSVHGHVGLVNVVAPPSTLVCPCVATLGGPCSATLGSPLERAACNF